MWPWKIPALAVAPPWLLLVADACVLEISFGLLVKCTFWFSTYTKNNRWSLNNLSMKLYFLNTYDRGMSFSLVFLLLFLYYIFSELFVFPDFVFLYFLYVSEIWIKLTIDQLTKILKEKKMEEEEEEEEKIVINIRSSITLDYFSMPDWYPRTTLKAILPWPLLLFLITRFCAFNIIPNWASVTCLFMCKNPYRFGLRWYWTIEVWKNLRPSTTF